MARKKPLTKSRSAITGRYVRKSYAKKHPNTTVNERIKEEKIANIIGK